MKTTKQIMMICCLMVMAAMGYGQEWAVSVDETDAAKELIAVDGGEHILSVGSAPGRDGCLLKVDKDGNYISRQVHLPGMALRYYSAIELDNGNYMAFGICDDSLADPHYQRYMQVDVFDNQLESVASRTYDMKDDVTDLFSFPENRCPMKSIITKKGTVLLAAAPSKEYSNNYGYYYQSVLRFFEFDEEGNLLRIVDNPTSTVRLSDIKTITYAPNSDNLMVYVGDGIFGNASGFAGMMMADTAYNIVAKQSLWNLDGLECEDIGCDGHWIDGQFMILDVEQYIGQSFTFHTLYKIDSARNVYAHHDVEPADSCTRVPRERNTAYVNDSTIFAISIFSETMYSSLSYENANILLYDKHLNLLGRKVIKTNDVTYFPSVPALFNDGGCLVLVRIRTGEHYQGEPFTDYELMKFRREDIEITWDVVQENETETHPSPYPNPTKGILNIPIGETDCQDARLQIFDMKGVKCFDCAITRQGDLITVDTQNLEAGVYVYRIISGSKEIADGKFVKE
jgi:hypothetical protein